MRSLFGRPSPRRSVDWVPIADLAAWERHQEKTVSRARQALERGVVRDGKPITVRGVCWVCRASVDFLVDFAYSLAVDGVLSPNWREQMLCPTCHLNNRMRATIHFLETRLAPLPGAAIYVTEQTTPFYKCLSERCANVRGSEYLGNTVALGATSPTGIRNESITNLTFAPASFDLIVSLEVFEHVPDFERGLRECLRVLRPDGVLLFSVPFRPDLPTNELRAVVSAEGDVQHLLPAEYHGDPLQTAGCLAFHSFGWQLLDQVRAAGFSDVAGYTYWSREYGYLGSSLTLFVARPTAPETPLEYP